MPVKESTVERTWGPVCPSSGVAPVGASKRTEWPGVMLTSICGLNGCMTRNTDDVVPSFQAHRQFDLAVVRLCRDCRVFATNSWRESEHSADSSKWGGRKSKFLAYAFRRSLRCSCLHNFRGTLVYCNCPALRALAH